MRVAGGVHAARRPLRASARGARCMLLPLVDLGMLGVWCLEWRRRSVFEVVDCVDCQN
jgi:hypothetical protein